MAQVKHLTNAPIKEALIDFRVSVPEEVRPEDIVTIEKEIKDIFPERKERWTGSIEIEFKGPDMKSQAANELDGYQFHSADKKNILQLTRSGFTFNWLEPYKSWSDFRNEAFKYWQLYESVVSPSIKRVGLRYINNLAIPLPILDFADYINAAPQVPEALPQAIHSFLTRVMFQDPDSEAFAMVTQALESIDFEANVAPIVLDIDVYQTSENIFGNDEAWEMLEKFRTFKNKIFFESITDKTEGFFL